MVARIDAAHPSLGGREGFVVVDGQNQNIQNKTLLHHYNQKLPFRRLGLVILPSFGRKAGSTWWPGAVAKAS
jgi:hypothetical protein